MVERKGIEPSTSRVRFWRSPKLSYRPANPFAGARCPGKREDHTHRPRGVQAVNRHAPKRPGTNPGRPPRPAALQPVSTAMRRGFALSALGRWIRRTPWATRALIFVLSMSVVSVNARR